MKPLCLLTLCAIAGSTLAGAQDIVWDFDEVYAQDYIETPHLHRQ